MSSFVSKIVRSGSVPIYLVTFKDPDQRDCWFYLTSTPEKMKLLAALYEGSFNIHDYGNVLACGFGLKPTDEERQHLKDIYKLD